MKLTIVAIFALICLAFVAPRSNATVHNFVTDYGGSGDGVTDNRDALSKAFDTIKSGDTLDIPAGTYRIVLTTRVMFATPNVVVQGAGAATILNLVADSATPDYREFFRPYGDHFTLSNLTVNRGDGTDMVIFPVTPHDGFTVSNCTINGNVKAYGGYCHAFAIGLHGTTTNFTLSGDTITDCTFGLIQSSPGNTNHIVVKNCHFAGNHGDDLGFNNPSVYNSTCSDVTVANCTFVGNASVTTSGGFAVAFAHVANATLTHCYMNGYYNEGVHIEDYCNGIVVAHNNLVNVGRGISAPYCVTISTGSKNITLDNNTIDARANQQPNLFMIVAVGNEGYLPQHITLTNNHLIDGRQKHVQFYVQPGIDSTVSGNVSR